MDMTRALPPCCVGLLVAASATAQTVAFDEHAIAAPFQVQQALTGNFADVPSILFVGGEDDATECAVHALGDAGWSEVHRGVLPDGTVLADSMSIAGGDRFVIFDGTHFSWLDPADWRFKRLDIRPESSLYRGKPSTVVVSDVGRDVNGDDADDLVLLDFDGIWIALQDASGGFHPSSKLPIPPLIRATDNSVSFTVPPMHAFDYDGDGRGDLAVQQDDQLIIFKDAVPGAEPKSIAIPGGLTDPSSDRSLNDDAPTRTLRDVADHNGDGIADITISTAMGQGPMEAETATLFHFGRRQDGATVFDEEPTSAVATGSFGDIQMVDIDGDGREDVVALAGEFSVGKIAMAIMTGSISLDAAIYLLGEEGFDDEAAATRKMKVGENSPGPTFADVNGDGRQDMVQGGRRLGSRARGAKQTPVPEASARGGVGPTLRRRHTHPHGRGGPQRRRQGRPPAPLRAHHRHIGVAEPLARSTSG